MTISGTQSERSDRDSRGDAGGSSGRHGKALGKLAEFDEEILEEYLEGTKSARNEIRNVLRKATIESKMTPVLCGSAFRNKGVQLFLDAVVDYLPSPLELPPIRGTEVKTETGEESC